MQHTVNYLPRYSDDAKTVKPRCNICARATKGNKTWCSDHIENDPRAQWIMKQLEDQEKELEAVRQTQSTKPIKHDSLTVKEIVNALYIKGPKTARCLSQEFHIDSDIIDVYIRYMRQMAIVKLHTSKRNTSFIVLAAEPSLEDRMPAY